MTSIQKIALYLPTGRNSSVLAFARITFKLVDGSSMDIDNWRILPSRRGFYVAPSSQRVQTGESVLFEPVITFGSQAFKREFQEIVLAEFERWRTTQSAARFEAVQSGVKNVE